MKDSVSQGLEFDTSAFKLWSRAKGWGIRGNTYPECVVEVCVTTDSDWEAEDRACWAARLQLIKAPWVWGWCRGCSSGCGWGWGCWGCCCSWSWGLIGCWFIQDGPLWERVCREQQEQLGLFGTQRCDYACVFYDLWWQPCLPAWACWFTCLFNGTCCWDINKPTITPSLQAK